MPVTNLKLVLFTSFKKQNCINCLGKRAFSNASTVKELTCVVLLEWFLRFLFFCFFFFLEFVINCRIRSLVGLRLRWGLSWQETCVTRTSWHHLTQAHRQTQTNSCVWRHLAAGHYTVYHQHTVYCMQYQMVTFSEKHCHKKHTQILKDLFWCHKVKEHF